MGDFRDKIANNNPSSHCKSIDMGTPQNSSTIYFVVSKIFEPIKTILKQNKPLPPVEEAMQMTYKALYENRRFVILGEISWITQTFFHMKEAGLNVALTEEPVENAICIAHYDYLRDKFWSPDFFIVGIRGDRSPLYTRELEVVQTPSHLSKTDQFLIIHWPQFGLVKRNSSRKNSISRISYFGEPQNLGEEFKCASFIDSLKKLDVQFNICVDPAKWSDYSETDVVLAVRKHIHPLNLRTKPATKLFNCWLAECIPLLGIEPAFRSVGKIGLDYFEINSSDEVIKIIKKLKEHPELVDKVIQRGAQRSSEFTFEVIKEQWIEFLLGPVSDTFEEWKISKDKKLFPQLSNRYWETTNQWLAHKIFWAYIHIGTKFR